METASKTTLITSKDELRAFLNVGADLLDDLIKSGKIKGRKLSPYKTIWIREEIELQIKALPTT